MEWRSGWLVALSVLNKYRHESSSTKNGTVITSPFSNAIPMEVIRDAGTR